ncbi:MAG: hypothetical protein ACE5GW_04860 [Planctomycetota bacterium]
MPIRCRCPGAGGCRHAPLLALFIATILILPIALPCAAQGNAGQGTDVEKLKPPPSGDERAPAGEGKEGEAADTAAGEEQRRGDEENPLDGIGMEGQSAIRKLLDEITRNMQRIEKLLNQDRVGEATQDKQLRAVEQIEKLIEEVERATSYSSGGGGGTQQPQQGESSEDQALGRKQQQMKEEMQRRKQQGEANMEPQSPEKVPNDRTTEGQVPPVEVGNLKDRQGRGRWGRLPKTVIEQMYDNGRRKLPEKYRMLLEEYFRKLPDFRAQ